MRRKSLNKAFILVFFIISNVPLLAATQTTSVPAVYTVNYPLQYFAERIAGELAEVIFPIPVGEDPAYWTPDEATLLQYQQADLILINGANYAHWLTTISLPINRLVNTSQDVKDHYIYSTDIVTHTHGPGDEHSHNNLAANVWLDMMIAKEQAGSIASAFIKLMPEHKESLQQNLQLLLTDLNGLDIALQNLGKSFAEIPILASHPVYQYLSRRYFSNMQILYWEPDQIPELGEWQNMEVILKQYPAKWMLWEAPPLNETTESLLKMGVKPVVFYTLSNRPLNGDFMSIMNENIKRLKSRECLSNCIQN